MKKILLCLSLLFILIGCSTDQSPESYFDNALIEVESLEAYTSNLMIKIDNDVIYEATFDIENGDVISVTTLYSMDSSDFERIATMNYSDTFNQFSHEENIITCEIPVDSSSFIEQVSEEILNQEVSSISQKMVLNDEDVMDYTEITAISSSSQITFIINIERP